MPEGRIKSGLVHAVAALAVGLVCGLIVVHLADFPLRWTIAFAMLLAFCLAWPVYGWVTRDPEKLVWIVLFISIPLDFDVHLTYREYVGTFNGILVNITDVCYAMLAGFWVMQNAREGVWRFRIPFIAVLPGFLYLLAQTASLLNAADIGFSVYSLVQNTKVFLCFCFMANRIREPDLFRRAWELLMWCLILESAICFLQFVTGANYTTAIKTAENYGEDVFRVGGTTGSPNVTASYLASLLPIPVVSWFADDPPKPRALVAVSAVAGLLALLLTQTRGAWVNFALGMVIFFVATGKARHLGKVAAGVAVFAAVFLGFFHDLVWERFSEGLDTLMYRLQLMQSAFRMIRAHTLFGIGVNNYALVMGDYVPFFLTQERWIVHNRYLLVASETGLVGLLAFLAVQFTFLKMFWKARKAEDPFLATFSTGLFFSLLIFSMQMMMESLDGRISDSHFWLIAGIGTAIYRCAGFQPRETES
jgi:putative inorganic carbon (hco3(-)) transporter